MTAEREYVIQKSEKLGSMLKGHPYHPRQMHIVVQTAIIPIFLYSVAMAQWTSKDLSKLWKVWCRAFKHDWKLKPTIVNGFFYTAQHGGLDTASPGEIWVKETAGQMLVRERRVARRRRARARRSVRVNPIPNPDPNPNQAP